MTTRSRTDLPLGVIVATGAATLLVSMDNLVVIVALPSIGAELGAGLAGLQWTIAAYTLAFAAMLLPAAALGDRFGRRAVMLGGLALFAVASGLGALAASLPWLLAARALQGAAAAPVFTLSLTLLVASTPRSRRAVAIGLWSALSGLGVSVGPVVGGLVTQAAGWRGIFWINIPLAAAVAGLARARVRESRDPAGRRLDVVGVLLAGAGVFLLIAALIRGGDAGAADLVVLGGAGGAVVCLWALWWRQARSAHPLVPSGLLRTPAFLSANAVSAALYFTIFGLLLLLSLLLRDGHGLSPAWAGLVLLAVTGPMVAAAAAAGPLTGRVGAAAVATCGMGLLAVAAGGLALGLAERGGPAMAIALALAGTAVGLTLPAVSTAMFDAADHRDHGRASGVTCTVREMGGAVGVAVLGAVFVVAGGEGGRPEDVFDGFSRACWWAAGAAALGVLFARGLRGPSRVAERLNA